MKAHNHMPAVANERFGLPNVRRRLAAGAPVRIAFLGGSITEGAGASERDATSYRALTERYFRERYPRSRFDFVNAGVGGTNSSFGAHRLQEHVWQAGAVDLLFVEFSVNDGDDRRESMRGMEGIARWCRREAPRTDLCFLYAAADKNLASPLPFNIAVHEEVAAYYGIPSVNFAAGLYAAFGGDAAQWAALAPDRVHPNDAGHARYAEALRSFLEAALQPAAEEASDAEAGARAVAPLPAPLEPANYGYAAMGDVREADRMVGFELRRDMPQPFMNWRYDASHWLAERPGAELRFTVDGLGAGLLLLCGPDTGTIEYAIDGMDDRAVNPFDDWCLKAYRPVPLLFPPGDGRRVRRVAVRVAETADPRSTGVRLRVLKLLRY